MANEENGRARELMGTWVSLIGSAMGMFSVTQTWLVDRSKVVSALSSALYVSPSAGRLNGFQVNLGNIRIGWLLLPVCALCGLMLLAFPAPKDRSQFLKTQVVWGSLVLFIALIHIRPLAGPVLAVISGTLLIVGAFLRYR